MTLPSLPDLDSEADSALELIRVTVAVGRLQIDVGLPTNVSIALIVGGVIKLANKQLALRGEPTDAKFDSTAGKWTLARLGDEPMVPSRSLAQSGVYDGAMLVIREIGVPSAPLLFDDVEVVSEAPSNGGRRREFVDGAWTIGCFAVSLVASVAAALLFARQATAMAAVAAALAAGAVGVLVARMRPYRMVTAPRSAWLAAVAIPLIFAGSLHVVPGGSAAGSLSIAFDVTAFVALVALLASGRGRSFFTAVIALSVFGACTTISMLLWTPALRAVGAILATASVIVVYLAPRATIVLSRLPLPPVPTAGEPLDDIETQGGTAVEGVNAVGKQVIPTEEGMIERVRPANQYLTGIVAAATVTAIIGGYLALDVSNGFFWQGTVFGITVATVLCLRGRSHYDLVQSATLIGGGMLIGFALIVKTATHLDGWRVSAALALVALMVFIVAFGLIAPRLEFSPVLRRQVEILEYVAIALVFPLCFWIIRLYAFFRELRL